MMSIQKGFLFIHVPKTGGNSIQEVLKQYSEDEVVVRNKRQDGVERFQVLNPKYSLKKHSTISHYKAVLDANTYKNLFKCSIIRNPWDMMISLYFSPHRGRVRWDRREFANMVAKAPTLRQYVCEASLFERQLMRTGINLSRKKLDEDVDALLRFESLESEFQALCEKIGIPHTPLKKRNSSEREHYSFYYDTELKDLVRKKFWEEIEYGNYVFDRA